jgi:serine/threonine protein kinase
MLDADGRPIELGRGAMGTTYKAFDVDLRYPVTLKVISERYLGDESAQLRFLREARAAASVRHPNVASVFHLGRTGSSYFYAMEFVEGETLEHLVRRSGRVKAKMALEIMAQVAAGLAAVYERNLVHRDIKPSNIMVRLRMTALSRQKSSISGWPSRWMSRVLKPRFRRPGLSLEHRSSPVPSNSLESVWTYGQICIRSASRSGRW